MHDSLIADSRTLEQLFTKVIDAQEALIALLEGEKMVMANFAFLRFFGVRDVTGFEREFGALQMRFVPHDAYFHPAKAPECSWLEALGAIDEEDRIVSMISHRTEPHAFSVRLDRLESFTIVTMTDISRTLIKRIMSAHQASIDAQSGAFSREYFIHTVQGFADTARYNEKALGLSMIALESSAPEAQWVNEETLSAIVRSISDDIRAEDMLVRWSKKEFLLVYLTGTEAQAQILTRKLRDAIARTPGLAVRPRARFGLGVLRLPESPRQLLERVGAALELAREGEIVAAAL